VTFLPPETSGEVHHRLCQKFAGKPVVTIGYGPDFAVPRSRGVRMNIPQMVRELIVEIPNDGVISGGGHLVVGSVKFVGGMRKDWLAKKIAACAVDEVIPIKQVEPAASIPNRISCSALNQICLPG
jgi:RecJ-like exonuclease